MVKEIKKSEEENSRNRFLTLRLGVYLFYHLPTVSLIALSERGGVKWRWWSQSGESGLILAWLETGCSSDPRNGVGCMPVVFPQICVLSEEKGVCRSRECCVDIYTEGVKCLLGMCVFQEVITYLAV